MSRNKKRTTRSMGALLHLKCRKDREEDVAEEIHGEEARSTQLTREAVGTGWPDAAQGQGPGELTSTLETTAYNKDHSILGLFGAPVYGNPPNLPSDFLHAPFRLRIAKPRSQEQRPRGNAPPINIMILIWYRVYGNYRVYGMWETRTTHPLASEVWWIPAPAAPTAAGNSPVEPALHQQLLSSEPQRPRKHEDPKRAIAWEIPETIACRIVIFVYHVLYTIYHILYNSHILYTNLGSLCFCGLLVGPYHVGARACRVPEACASCAAWMPPTGSEARALRQKQNCPLLQSQTFGKR